MSGATTAELPDVNDLVDVMLDTRTEPLAAAISAISGDTLLLREPIDRTGRMVLPEPGDLGLLIWGANVNLRQVPIAILQTSRHPGPTWLVRRTGPAERCQRRSFVRAAVHLPIIVRQKDTDLDATATDLSEGGIRCTVGSEVALARGDAVTTEFDAGHHLTLAATVVRLSRADTEGMTDLGLSFTDLSITEADKIRQYVFRQLNEQRRRGAA